MRLAVLAFLGAALSAGGAHAVVYTVTYTGTAGGFDERNYFGLGVPLEALAPAFTLRFTIDTAAAYDQAFPGIRIIQGTGVAGSNPIVQTSFTLNHRTISFGNSTGDGFDDSYGVDRRYNVVDDPAGFYLDEIYHYSYDVLADIGNADFAAAAFYSQVNDILPNLDPAAPLDYHLQAGDVVFDSAFHSRRSSDGGLTFDRYVYLPLNITRVTIAPVPEPATWALMILGFGAAGAMLRRRQVRDRADA